MSNLYEADFYAWLTEQATLLRGAEFANEMPLADFANIAEELESMGRSEREQLTSRLGVLLAHLLKWQYQPSLRGNSWRLTIAEQRRRIARLMARSPSLRAHLPAIIVDAYGDAVLIAERETGLDAFPDPCPWTFEQAMSEDLA
jgi:hypothetical protein